MVIIDNSILSFALQISNGVPISSFTGEVEDREMEFLGTYLESLYHHKDVRILNRKMFKLEEYLLKC